MLGMGDIDGFIEKLSAIDINQEDVVEKLTTGKFRLVDFKNLYSQIMSLGPISKMLEMIPGLGNMAIPDEHTFRKLTFVFDSMNKKELESNGDIFLKSSKRIDRVARCSGTTREIVSEMLGNFRQMSSMMKKLMGNPMFAQMLQGKLNEDDKKQLADKTRGKVPSGVFDYINSLN